MSSRFNNLALKLEKIGEFTFRKMDEASGREIIHWQYDSPYDFYNHSPLEIEDNVQQLLNPGYQYFSVWDDSGTLIGYRCFGEDARVPGGDYSKAALDMGGGLKPDLTGQGLGTEFMKAAFEFARHNYAPKAFRATVATFNKRALRVCEKVGYRKIQTFESTRTRKAFNMLIRGVD